MAIRKKILNFCPYSASDFFYKNDRYKNQRSVMNYLIGRPSYSAIGVGSATVVFPQNDLLHVTSAFMVVKALLLKAKFTFLFLSPFEFVHSRCTLPQWWPF